MSLPLQARQNAAEFAAQQRQLAECCCELREGQQGIKTAIAMQTNDINSVATANTQRILDQLCETRIQTLTQSNENLRSELNKAEILAAVSKECG